MIWMLAIFFQILAAYGVVLYCMNVYYTGPVIYPLAVQIILSALAFYCVRIA